MVKSTHSGTRNVPLKLAEAITAIVNAKWENGEFLDKVTPVTKDLLRFWDPKGSFADLRNSNFHRGQWQSILNSIYIHEVMKLKNVQDIYMTIEPQLLQEMDLLDMQKNKYLHPKYCIKMATGTGKTWVMHALLIWQYLNAKHEETTLGTYSKKFLFVAPGLIVYERLLDAYLGKTQENGQRDFDTSDLKKFEDIFIPEPYREEIFNFVQSAVCTKEEIARKTTGDGLIAITNWHLLAEVEENDENISPLEDPSIIVKKEFPIRPGTSAGHSLDVLDSQYFKGKQLDFLANLSDIVVFNDEAHHLGEWKKEDEVLEKKWQKALSKIQKDKKDKFIQVDFSATPYNVTGSGQNRQIHYFPHIIANFELKEAIKLGLVKTVAIDKRKEVAALPLDFKAEKDGKGIKLSDGQRVMLRAGLSKLKILEDGFTSFDKEKYPKMLVICEDTSVVPYVTQFFKQEGLSDDEIMEIHSNKKGEVKPDEWETIKQRLFNLDKHSNPKVVISVLMLREGFDVNNICVIVPLRSSTSYILLEQVIGRGLRLMWREPDYTEIKNENREKLLVKKQEPDNYLDILSIVEHPAFIEFYERVLEDAVGKVEKVPERERVIGDLINIGLKDDYKDYDLFWPIIIHDKEEFIEVGELSVEDLEPFPTSLDKLKKIIPKHEGDIFYGEELTVRTRFGEYIVTSDIFNAKNYNSFISKLINIVSTVPVKISKRNTKNFPVMQINTAQIAQLADRYIRYKLFNQEFDPLIDNNWKVLLLTESRITEHIIRNISTSIYDLQNKLDVNEAKIVKRQFSEVTEIKGRERYCIEVSKSIYPKVPFPSNKGGFERAFIEFIDRDAKVEKFVKINEYAHNFASILYIREDGLLSHYFPDFIVKVNNIIYLVETKAERDVNNPNVKLKQISTVDWINKINELNEENRMSCTWKYVLLGEKTFYSMSDKGATTSEILEYNLMSKSKIRGTLTRFISDEDDKY
ncbi:type I restriction enzyme EcoKI subunit R [Methanosarcina mazei TMA]|uniref:DEAD/DEAH box helicase n=1 Tax=Methanosarcina mazei TaxID=2209 RepID=UPI001C33919F|nr:DEAD/DEAH box helicase family protein [Methanosarcina mazei]UWJ22788.1 type I restriction enzyme EcoKI subunit R [Methanosarcina mazei TMA]BBL63612.1 type III restriction endonuclease subunit R [Methanosarcina mazei]